MASKTIRSLMISGVLVGSGALYFAQAAGAQENRLFGNGKTPTYAVPTQLAPTLAAPPGMVPMIVYVPAPTQYRQPMAVPVAPPVAPHTHAPQPPRAAQTIQATHCSINDVDVLTQDAPSCEKAGGKVVAERASFADFQGTCPPGWDC